MEAMYYIGLDVHKRTISYCVKGASGRCDTVRYVQPVCVRTLTLPP